MGGGGDVKACKDCRYFMDDGMCSHESAKSEQIDVINGSVVAVPVSAEANRFQIDAWNDGARKPKHCTLDAYFFEQK